MNLRLVRIKALADHLQHAASFDVESDDFVGIGKLPTRDWTMCRRLKDIWSSSEHRL